MSVKEVHLFVRSSKLRGKTAAPFTYPGQPRFMAWEGEGPITIECELPRAGPDSAASCVQYRLTFSVHLLTGCTGYGTSRGTLPETIRTRRQFSFDISSFF